MVINDHQKSGEQSQDFELNIASIIDCFTVLITYLLVSASFIAIGVFDISIATNGESAESASKSPPISMTVVIKSDHAIHVNLSGAVNKTILVQAKENDWDYATLGQQIEKIKGEYAQIDTAVVTAGSGIVYKQVVKTIEAVKKGVPQVYIGDQEVN